MALAALICTVAAASVLAAVPEPLGINNKALGGGPLNQYTPGVAGGVGLNNIGLLVRTWGTVTYVDPGQQFFYIDDGSALDDKSGFRGVRVSYAGLAAGNTFNPPSIGERVVITGISSTSAISTAQGTRIIPTLRPRRQADMAPL